MNVRLTAVLVAMVLAVPVTDGARATAAPDVRRPAPARAVAPPGPPLREPAGALAASLECSPGLATASKPPVILVHGTTSSPEDSWGWGYRKVLPELGYPTCTVRLPERANVDLQRSAEYVVHAVRTVAALAHRRVDVVGHSQGAFHAVYTQKFWPDLRFLVDDVVALSGPFAEADGVQAGCNQASCTPPFRQRQKGAAFFGAFLQAPLPAGPSYTAVLTLDDEVTRPQPASSTLTGPPGVDVRTITVQDVCANRVVDHLGMVGDAVVFQLVMDALTHPGAADPARITPACDAQQLPGVDQPAYAAALVSSAANLATAGATSEQSPTEPPIRCYLDPACESVVERGPMIVAAHLDGRLLVVDTQAPGSLRVVVRRTGRPPRRLLVATAIGRTTVRLPRRIASRYRVRLQARPDGYTRLLTEVRRVARG